MASIKSRITTRLSALRERRPFVDHLFRMQQHYGGVSGSQQAGAVTYFAFLSFFPILALAFFVVGYVARLYPNVQQNLTSAIEQLLPGFLGNKEGQIQLADIQNAAGAVGLIGLVGVIYSGLGWLSGMRDALVVVFELPAKEQPSFVSGKLRDLMTLALIGVILIVSVSVSGFVSGFSTQLLEWIGLGAQLSPVFQLVTVVLGLLANMLLFFAMFRLLAEPHTPKRSLWSGALLGAVGFEVLKRLSGLLLGATKDQPAFQAFGIALILLVWINYFSRVVLYAAAFAHTSRESRAQRPSVVPDQVQGPPVPALASVPQNHGAARPTWVAPFAAGGAAVLTLVALLRKKPGSRRAASASERRRDARR